VRKTGESTNNLLP